MAHCLLNSSLDKCGSTVSCSGCHQYEKDAPDTKEATPSASNNTKRDAIIADIKEYLIERAQQHDAWWLDNWVEREIDGYVNSRNNSTHL